MSRLHRLGLLILLLTMAATAPAAEVVDRDAWARRIGELRHQDRLTEALAECRAYNLAHPGDPVMLYNQACLANRNGDVPAAVADFRAALATGFMDLEHARRDPDLQGEAAAVIGDLITEEDSRLVLLARERGRRLEFETWTDPDLLHPLGDDPAPSVADEPQLRLRWRSAGLEIELNVAADQLPANEMVPWRGGPGLFVVLAVPDSLATYESDDHFLFAFGVVKGGGTGALYLPQTGRWQRLRELDPKFRPDAAGRVILRGLIPWHAVAPYHPLVDNPLGFNARLATAGSTVDHEVFPSRDLFRPTSPQRRIVPLVFALDTLAEDALFGKVSRTISGAGPVDLACTIVSQEAGAAALAVDFVDLNDVSVLPSGPQRRTLELTVGANAFERQVDFSQLRTGPYRIKVDLRLPSGRRASWGTALLHMAPGWQDAQAAGIANLPPSEQATANHHLAAITVALTKHPARRSPGAIATTTGDLATMLANAATRGTILPDQGTFLFVYPGPGGRERRCHLALPPGRDPQVPVQPVLILERRPGDAARLVSRILQNYDHGPAYRSQPARVDGAWPVFLIPEVRAGHRPEGEHLAEAEACLDWAFDYFGASTTRLVGSDAAGLTALQLARSRADDVTAVLIFAGADLEPWPQATPDFIRTRLAPAPAVPITWVDFVAETTNAGQGRQIFDAMGALNYAIADTVTVKGGLNLTQVADRTVLWISEKP